MVQDTLTPVRAEDRLIPRSDLVACTLAFIDCKVPGSTLKENYSIIGPGVTQSEDQVINLPEPHGFNVGAAAMPNGVTNNLHIHYTAEVFLVFRGEWLFRWGVDGKDGEIIGREGDVVSMPTWMFRGFTNVGPDDGWLFTVLGRDDTGGVIWDPRILRGAADHGLYLSRDNTLIDTSTGAPKPADEDLIRPLDADFIASLRHVPAEEMLSRITTKAERIWSDRALLDTVLPGHAAALASVIGPGMTEDRTSKSKVMVPHGFSVEWLRIEPGQTVGPYRVGVKQVFILKTGQIAMTLGRDNEASRCVMGAWDTFSAPEDIWRTLRAEGDESVEIIVVTAGDARPRIEWDAVIVASAWDAGVGRDPNGYLAPADLLPFDAAPGRSDLARK